MDRHGFGFFWVKIVLRMGWAMDDEGFGWATVRVKDWDRVSQVFGLGLGL